VVLDTDEVEAGAVGRARQLDQLVVVGGVRYE